MRLNPSPSVAVIPLPHIPLPNHPVPRPFLTASDCQIAFRVKIGQFGIPAFKKGCSKIATNPLGGVIFAKKRNRWWFLALQPSRSCG
jgi:hypothetical protein